MSSTIYLDDFLTMRPSLSSVCQQNLNTFVGLCNELGVPLAPNKVEGPSTTLAFLGIILDTQCMENGLPQEKLTQIQVKLKTWLKKKNTSKRDILSLVGLLQHAKKVVKPGRTFVARMYTTATKLQKMHFLTRLNKELRSDLMWWHTFLQSWNGLSMLC